MKISAINSMYINNRNLQTKPQIKFGESEVFDTDSTKKPQKTLSPKEIRWQIEKDRIEASYRKRIENLSHIADESGMNNNVYWENVRAIQKEKDLALRQAFVYLQYDN